MNHVAHLSNSSTPGAASRQAEGLPSSLGGPISQERVPDRKLRTPCTSPGSTVRCSEKACVFPSTGTAMELCLYHERLRREPAHFCSFQPTLLVISQAAFGVSAYESDNSRAQDRRRLEAQCKAFQEGLA